MPHFTERWRPGRVAAAKSRGMPPRPTGRKGRPFSDARRMLESIVYRYRTGIAWRDLPEVVGSWQTVWTRRHHRMAVDGTWDRVLAKLTAAADAEAWWAGRSQ